MNTENRPRRKPETKPKPVLVEEIPVSPFLLEDASLIVARALSEPLPVRKGSWNTKIFTKTQRELTEAFGPLPEPVASRFPSEARLAFALEILFCLKFISSSSGRITVSKAGGAWLRQEATNRLKTLIDTFRKHRKFRSHSYAAWGPGPLGFSPGLLFRRKSYNATRVESAAWIEEVWTQAGVGRFFLLEEWLTYHSRASPPPGVDPDDIIFGSTNHRQGTAPNGQEAVLRDFHEEFFFARLIPLGGVRLGRPPDGQLGFSLSKTGRYLLGNGRGPDPLVDVAASVVVQPNFEIVFMQPSALAEAEVAGFSDRCGHRVGSLFRVTKSSILKAARSGGTAARVIETLSRISSKPLPENVRHQILGWFSVCRDVEVRRALILTVPDEETARRITVEFGETCREIAPRTLELPAGSVDARSVKKLESVGIFLRNRSRV